MAGRAVVGRAVAERGTGSGRGLPRLIVVTAASIAGVPASASRLRRLLIGPVLVVAATVTAAGCGTVSYGSAAVADDRRISVGELQNATAQIQDIAGPTGQISQVQVLDWLVVEPWAVDIAAKYGVGVSTDDAVQLIHQANSTYDPASQLTPHRTAAPETIRAVRAMLALLHIQGQGVPMTQEAALRAVTDLQEKVRSAEIDVNPRYLGTTPNWFAGAETTPPGLGGADGGGADGGGQNQNPGEQTPNPGETSSGQAPPSTATP